MAETLDHEKMQAKLAAHNSELSFSEAFKSFKSTSSEVQNAVTEAGPTVGVIFPQLNTALTRFLDKRQQLEGTLHCAQSIFRIPDCTKVRKALAPRRNVIGELFGQSRVLNTQHRITELLVWKKPADTDRKLKADRKALLKQQKAAVVAEKNRRVQEEAPLLAWLIRKGYSAEGTKTITKKDMVRAFEAHKAGITKRIRDEGENISKQTQMNAMKTLFTKYKVYEL